MESQVIRSDIFSQHLTNKETSLSTSINHTSMESIVCQSPWIDDRSKGKAREFASESVRHKA